MGGFGDYKQKKQSLDRRDSKESWVRNDTEFSNASDPDLDGEAEMGKGERCSLQTGNQYLEKELLLLEVPKAERR